MNTSSSPVHGNSAAVGSEARQPRGVPSQHGVGNRLHTPSRAVDNSVEVFDPLLTPEMYRPRPPFARPEIEEVEDEEIDHRTNDAEDFVPVSVPMPFPGVDDGFFSPSPADGEGKDEPDLAAGRPPAKYPANAGPGAPPALAPQPPFFYHPDYGTDFDGISIPDVNVYQQKKTLAQGMMDLALFSANASQLRFVLESKNNPYFYPNLVMIAISLTLQVVVGVGLILNARYDVKDAKQICVANKVNNYTIAGIFIVTVVNVFISAFGVAST